MSPEQIQTPLNVTHLTDVYSFGCVLYEMLTGRQPYAQNDRPGDGQYAVMARRVHEPLIAPRKLNPEISPRLEQIVLTSLAPDPPERFSGCGSFARALQGVAQERWIDPTAGGTSGVSSESSSTSAAVVAAPESSHPKKVDKVSVGGNLIAAIVSAVAWIPFRQIDGAWPVVVLCSAISNVLLLRLLYKAWAALPAGHARTTPSEAVGYLFVPLYNLYWYWKAFFGFAGDYEKYLLQRTSQKPGAVGFFELICVVRFLLPVVAVIGMGQRGYLPFLIMMGVSLFDFMILIPIMVGFLANAINRLAAANQPPAMPAGAAERGMR